MEYEKGSMGSAICIGWVIGTLLGFALFWLPLVGAIIALFIGGFVAGLIARGGAWNGFKAGFYSSMIVVIVAAVALVVLGGALGGLFGGLLGAGWGAAATGAVALLIVAVGAVISIIAGLGGAIGGRIRRGRPAREPLGFAALAAPTHEVSAGLSRVSTGPERCPDCGASLLNDSAHCTACGRAVRVPCTHCGKLETIGSEFCGYCGRELTPVEEEAPPADEEEDRGRVHELEEMEKELSKRKAELENELEVHRSIVEKAKASYVEEGLKKSELDSITQKQENEISNLESQLSEMNVELFEVRLELEARTQPAKPEEVPEESEAVEGLEPTDLPYACPTCAEVLEYNPIEKIWYCHGCQVYREIEFDIFGPVSELPLEELKSLRRVVLKAVLSLREHRERKHVDPSKADALETKLKAQAAEVISLIDASKAGDGRDG